MRRPLSPWFGAAAMAAWFVALQELLRWLEAGMNDLRALVSGAAVTLVWLVVMFGLARWTDNLRRRRRDR